MPGGYLFGDQAVKQIRDVVRQVQNESRNGPPGAAEPFTKFGPHLIRIGRTCTNAEFPTYPTSDANTFVVEFGFGAFTEVPGEQTLTFTPYDEPFERVCRDLGGRYWEEGSLVACVLLRGKWYIVGASGVEIIRFKTTTNLALGGQATAIEIGTGTAYTETGVSFPIKDPWNNPGSWREDIHSSRRSSPGGYRGWCLIPTDAEETEEGEAIREIIWMEQLAESIDFTLVTDMAGGQAEITVDKYYQGKNPDDVWPYPSVTMYVYDPQGLYPRALAGCKGKARYNNREHKYEVVTCDQQVTDIKFTLGADMCSDSNAVIGGATRISWPTFGKMPSPAPTTATNPYGLAGKAGDAAKAYFNDTSGEWEVDQVLHVEKEMGIEFGHYYVDDCGSLRMTKRKVSVMRCDDTDIFDDVALYEELVLVDGIGGGIDDNTAESGSGSSQCVVDVTWATKSICTIQTNPAQTAANGTHELFQATPRDAVERVYVDGTWLKQTIGVHYVICFEEPNPGNIIEFTDECP